MIYIKVNYFDDTKFLDLKTKRKILIFESKHSDYSPDKSKTKVYGFDEENKLIKLRGLKDQELFRKARELKVNLILINEVLFPIFKFNLTRKLII
jgi:hypothetical protein